MPPQAKQPRRLRTFWACGFSVALIAFIAISLHVSQGEGEGVRGQLAAPHAAAGSYDAAAAPFETERVAKQSGNATEAPFTSRSVLVTLLADGKDPLPVTLALAEHPQWVKSETTLLGGVRESIDAAAVQASIEQGEITEIRFMKPATVLSAKPDKNKVVRATTDGIAKPGYVFDVADAAARIVSAFTNDQQEVVIRATYQQPVVTVVLPDGTKKILTLLSTGLSDFSNSTPGREHNVHKAIEERVNNVLVPAGQTFSLVAALDAPITIQKGWLEDKGLFGGGAALTPGAGICQSATTLYRAALLAGLSIVEKKNHSLFVDHYEFMGIGLDATVFPRFHDLRFKNDTSEDLLIQAYTEGPTVYVHFFGGDDGRTAHLDGPYFIGSKNRPSALHALSRYQIGWVRTVAFADGASRVEPIYATYAKPLWNSLIKKYIGADGMKLLATVSAPEPMASK